MGGSNNYVKRTQKDYSLHFKLQLIREIESSVLSILGARKQYGIQGDSTVRKWLQNMVHLIGKIKLQQICQNITRTKNTGIGSQLRLLEKQKAQLERQHYIADEKAIFLI